MALPKHPISASDVALTLSWVWILSGCSGGSTGPLGGVRFTTVSAGWLHACGVSSQGDIYCWGANNFGQLGDGTTDDSSVPVKVASARNFQRVSAGFLHTCALAEGGTAFCWGSNFNGELGDGTIENALLPTVVSGGRNFKAVSAGEAHTCGITFEDLGYCWGAPLGAGLDGAARPPNMLEPTPLTIGKLADVSSGFQIACAVTLTGISYCWGANAPGVISDIDIGFPLPVTGAPRLLSISAGITHACGIGEDGTTYCWGFNTNGELGDGTTLTRESPVPVVSDLSFGSVEARSHLHSCALTRDGEAYCWGANAAGELGDGTTNRNLLPVAVTGNIEFASISIGFGSSCGLTPAGIIYCWGVGSRGQLGTDSFEDSTEPRPLATVN